MLVRNWMHSDPLTIPSHVLVSQAKRVLSENNLHALPVVDGGRLRGLVTRANLLRIGGFVLRTQDPDEFNYFVTRLRVRDVMVRNPGTVQAGDTMVSCLRKGQALGVAQFPVLDGEQVVGVISANEIFQIAAHCLEAAEQGAGVTLAPVRPGLLGRIAAVTESTGAVLQSLHPATGRDDAPLDDPDAARRIVVRFHGAEPREVANALAAAGFAVVEPAPAPRPALAA